MAQTDKIDKFKQCLATFGYRSIDKDIMAKPLAYLLICVKVTEDGAEFSLMFRKVADEYASGLWSVKEITFNEYMFEHKDILSGKIAKLEYELFAGTNPIHAGLGGAPFNFNKSTDYFELL